MKSLMRYTITSGRVVEKRDVLMDVSLDPTTGKKRPRGKRRGKTLAAQIERNCNETVKRLARILNCNYRGGDLFLTLKYGDARLPADRAAAVQVVGNFMKRIARAYLAATGEKLRWVMVTADKSSKTGESVRLHHHIVMDPVAWELIAAHWPGDQFSFRRLEGNGDYTGIARYMVRNAGYVRGRRTWSTSLGLEKPKLSAPVPVATVGSWQVPKEAHVVEREVRENAEEGFWSGYIRYVVPEETGCGKNAADTHRLKKIPASTKNQKLMCGEELNE